MKDDEAKVVREAFKETRQEGDKFFYSVVTVKTFQDALIAIVINPNIQTCLLRYDFPYKSKYDISLLRRYLNGLDEQQMEDKSESERNIILGSIIKEIRPELDLYIVTSGDVEEAAAAFFEKRKPDFGRS